jgi:hypothetical protein
MFAERRQEVGLPVERHAMLRSKSSDARTSAIQRD